MISVSFSDGFDFQCAKERIGRKRRTNDSLAIKFGNTCFVLPEIVVYLVVVPVSRIQFHSVIVVPIALAFEFEFSPMKRESDIDSNWRKKIERERVNKVGKRIFFFFPVYKD